MRDACSAYGNLPAANLRRGAAWSHEAQRLSQRILTLRVQCAGAEGAASRRPGRGTPDVPPAGAPGCLQHLGSLGGQGLRQAGLVTERTAACAQEQCSCVGEPVGFR